MTDESKTIHQTVCDHVAYGLSLWFWPVEVDQAIRDMREGKEVYHYHNDGNMIKVSKTDLVSIGTLLDAKYYVLSPTVIDMEDKEVEK